MPVYGEGGLQEDSKGREGGGQLVILAEPVISSKLKFIYYLAIQPASQIPVITFITTHAVNIQSWLIFTRMSNVGFPQSFLTD